MPVFVLFHDVHLFAWSIPSEPIHDRRGVRLLLSQPFTIVVDQEYRTKSYDGLEEIVSAINLRHVVTGLPGHGHGLTPVQFVTSQILRTLSIVNRDR